jgi:uncharacterized protein (TIGR03437 family)
VNIFCGYQPFNYDYADQYSLGFGSDVGYTDTATGRQYVISADGTVRLGFGIYPTLGLDMAIKAPTFTPPASNSSSAPPPYIFPNGVVNGASFAPFTSGIAPGELIAIFGANLGSATQVTFTPVSTPSSTGSSGATPPTGVLMGVYPQELFVVVPPGLPAGPVQIQVTTPAGTAAAVWEVVYPSAVGVETQAGNGLGAAATHANGTPVTAANPAVVGEIVNITVAGLPLSPSFSGASGATAGPIGVMVGAYSAVNSVAASGPGVATVSVTIPKGPSGVVPLLIETANSTAAQATIAVAPPSGSSTTTPTGSGAGTTTTTTTTTTTP